MFIARSVGRTDVLANTPNICWFLHRKENKFFMTLKLIDCFSGIGGFSYAAEKLVGGFKTVAFVECEPFCQKVLKKHWPNVPIYDDIKTYKPEPYSARVVCGGFPCQDISVAGRQRGITKETRSGLFFELMRVICLVRPQYVVLENVAAILNNGLDIVLRELSQAGYDAEWAIISASSVGACHQRSRWWLIAYPNNNGSSATKKSRSIEKTDGGAEERQNEIGKLERSSESRNSETIQLDVTYPSSDRLQRKIGARFPRQTWSQKNIRCLNPDWRSYESQPVLRRGDDGLSNRVDRLKALGNSVCPQVAAIPLQRVLDIDRGV